MRALPPLLQTKLNSGVTTLARCWIVTRRDGERLGFTDHDRDLAVDGVTCRAQSGLSSSETAQSFGLAVGGAEVFGALEDETLNEDDLAAGLYDAASVKLYLVDWSEPAVFALLAAGDLGEVRRQGRAFTAEVRGPAHRLAEPSGRLYTPACSADLGDARCGVNLDDPSYRGEGIAVSAQTASLLVASGLGSFDDGWFTAGKLSFTSGVNAGLAVEVKTHRIVGAMSELALWQAMPHAIESGDTFVVTAGCDKRFSTCRDRFANAINFRGFPHIPGNDFIIRRPTPGEPGHDGGSLGGSGG